jgi:mono/diheme cytochrome c family protein
MGAVRGSIGLSVFLFLCAAGAATIHAAQATEPQETSLANALPEGYTGRDIFDFACATCHGPDGKGSPQNVVGFDVPLPDFTDCSVATPEPLGDWFAVIHEGGPIRGLDRHMPAFGDALSADDIDKVIRHLWTFCSNTAWPRGDLNLPRTFFIEKAFPENETIFTTAITTRGPKSVGSEVVYERRLGVRNQFEIAVPLDVQQNADAIWSRGLGDVAVSFKRTFYASLDTGSIFTAGAEMVLPTGKDSAGFGHGFTVYEPFALFGQILPRGMFLQAAAGIEVPSDHRRGNNEVFWRGAFGGTLAQDRGFGRAWSPMVEVLWARATSGTAEWDVVPQMQVTLSKLQHIMVSGGVRIPVNERSERHPQVLTYLLWDWFDGGFFEFWR